MSAAPMNGRTTGHTVTDQRAGAFALLMLRFTLIGVAVALVGTLGSVVLKVVSH